MSAVKVKVEPKKEILGFSGAKLEAQTKTERCKHEVKGDIASCKREIKLEGKTSITDFMQRALSLRAKAESVKQEPGIDNRTKNGKKRPARMLTKSGKMRKKQKVTAKRRNSSREVMSRQVSLSSELAGVLGAPALSRPETVSRLWAHCKERGMVDPVNRREVRFDDELEQLFGARTARMTDFSRLLLPHFDYSTPVAVAKLESKVERRAKVEGVAKAERTTKVKAKPELEVKLELLKDAGVKREVAGIGRERAEALVVRMKRRLEEQSAKDRLERAEALVVRMKREGADRCTNGLAVVDSLVRSEQAAKIPKVASSPTAARSGTTLKPPASPMSAPAQVASLNDATAEEPRERERRSAQLWSSQEVLHWCSGLHIPELLDKAREYGLDGRTLLSLGEEDLREFGLAAPFLQRRVLDALDVLRKG